MTLATGSRLGPYEILAPIGAGGMGEVYRARDPRLGRDVAIKVLPPSFSQDADRLRRFEQEAKAAGILSHPNLTAVHDIGVHEGAPYVVQELLEGETLRAVLASGPPSARRAIDYSIQIVHGLAAAHEKGIVHRDLKPDNIFVTNDGRVKILDFGLAKLTHTEERGQATSLPTATGGTEPGMVLGTLGYMSPEQVKGKPADSRSDIFSFGAILYEMLSGKRAFHADSAGETMAAILKEDPPDLSTTNQNISPGLDRIVRHCLEKNPEQRFHSAHDLAFDLEALSGSSQPSAGVIVPSIRRRWPRPSIVMVAATAALGGLLIGWSVWKTPPHSGPSYRPLTFQRGFVSSARFAADGQTVFYGAHWDGAPKPQIFSKRLDSLTPLRLELPEGNVESVSRLGEMLILTDAQFATGYAHRGTLARAPLSGGAGRDLLEDVTSADWAPDGETLAVVRAPDWRYRLEFPAGKVIYETPGWISHVRVSPGGDAVAFLDHPQFGDDRGDVAIVDRAGKKKTLSTGWSATQGLAWSPSGKEIWFTASRSGNYKQLWGVTPAGLQRSIAAAPGDLTLHDVAKDGRALIDHSNTHIGVVGFSPNDPKGRDLTVLDWGRAPILSEDGKTVVFTEEGEGGGPGYSVFLRKMDGSAAARLGEGEALALSHDGKWVLAGLVRASPLELMLLPTGAGEPRRLPGGSVRPDDLPASFLPGDRGILFSGTEGSHPRRSYIRDLEGGAPRPVTPDNVVGSVLSPDGRTLVATESGGGLGLYPTEGGSPRPLPGQEPGDRPLRWTSDGQALFTTQVKGGSLGVPTASGLVTRVFRIDVATGRREAWSEFRPADPSGMTGFSASDVTPDGKTVVCTYSRSLSELYLAEGLR
jgi:serine/threonine protein kinase